MVTVSVVMSGQLATLRLSIDPLKVRDIPHGRTYLIIGKRNTGKTTLLCDLLFHRQHVLQFGIAIAGSIGSVVALRKFHPDTFIHEQFDPAALRRFYETVKKVNGRLKRRGEPMINFYLILDDTGFDDKMWNDKTLKEIMMNGRQYNLDCYLCLQYMKGITTSMRGQIDYCFIFREKSPENLKKIYDTFAGGFFESRMIFESVFKSCTLDKRALVIRNSDIVDESAAFDGGIFFYRAKVKHRDFIIGCDEMWRYHLRNYNEHYESDEDEADSSNAIVRGTDAPKKKSEISVVLKKPVQPSGGADADADFLAALEATKPKKPPAPRKPRKRAPPAAAIVETIRY